MLGRHGPGGPGTKSWEFLVLSRECPGATPTTPRGRGSCKGLQKHIYRETSSNGNEKPLLVSLELAGKPLTRIANRSVDGFDLVLEISWANECVALAVQVVSRHCGRLS